MIRYSKHDITEGYKSIWEPNRMHIRYEGREFSMVDSVWSFDYRIYTKLNVRNISLKLEYRNANGLAIELFFVNSSTRPRGR